MPIENSEEKLAFPPTKVHKGLLNGIGENNCFLNVTIQALWHLGPFRAELRKFIADHKASDNTDNSDSLLEAICNTFVQYEFTDQTVLPPQELRESLSKLSGRYELGKIADANEALDTILHRIHAEQSATCPHGGKCLSHKVFGGLVMEQTICSICRDTSEPTLRSDFIMCFQSFELINEARLLHAVRSADKKSPSADQKKFRPFSTMFKSNEKKADKNNKSLERISSEPDLSTLVFQPHDFGQLLHQCMEVSIRSCPSSDYTKDTKAIPCKGKGKVHFFSLEPPLALALSVGWGAATEEARTLRDFYSLISYQISLSDLFNTDSVSSGSVEGCGPSYTFRGLVCYYGLHYVSIFQDLSVERGEESRFLLFDDQKIRPLGDWEAVKLECIKSRYQPVLLLYELDKASSYVISEDIHVHDLDHRDNVMRGAAESSRSKRVEKLQEEQLLIDLSEDMNVVSDNAASGCSKSDEAAFEASEAQKAVLLQRQAEDRLVGELGYNGTEPIVMAVTIPMPVSPTAAVVHGTTPLSDHSTAGPIATPALPHTATNTGGFFDIGSRNNSKDQAESKSGNTSKPASRHNSFTGLHMPHFFDHSSHAQTKAETNSTSSSSSGGHKSSSSISAAFGHTYIAEQNKHPTKVSAAEPKTSSSSYTSSSSSSSGSKSQFNDSTSSYSKSTGSSYTDNRYSVNKAPSAAPVHYKAHSHQNSFHSHEANGEDDQWHHSSIRHNEAHDAPQQTHTNTQGGHSSSSSSSSFIAENNSFRARLSSAGGAAPGLVVKWSYRSQRYNVVLHQEMFNGKKTLGMNIRCDSAGHLMVSSLVRTATDELLPAERSGRICKNDKLIKMNGVSLEGSDNVEVMGNLIETSSARVVLDMESSTRFNLWFQCPACSFSNLVDEQTEQRLKSHNNHKHSDSGRKVPGWGRFILKCIVCKTESKADDSIL